MTNTLTAGLTLADHDGDTLRADGSFSDHMGLSITHADWHDPAGIVLLDRQQVSDLMETLATWLERDLDAAYGQPDTDDPCEPAQGDGQGREWCQHGDRLDNLPDAEADGYAWPTEAESILRDAHEATHGRDDQYGHPRGTLTVTAQFWTVTLQHKMRDGAYIAPEDVARCQIGTKLARDLHTPKRDNRVDIAGYAETLDRLETGK